MFLRYRHPAVLDDEARISMGYLAQINVVIHI